jgi:NAD(P)-dependent dehydrogenase (short-subunit alcohol dehydrogenase family)
MDELDGKVVVVTGGAAGIGFALARRFAGEGMKVMLADVEEPALETAARDLGEEFGEDRVAARVTDVRDAAAVEALAEATFDRFGTAHVVCNNAGVALGGVTWAVPEDRWRWIVDVNLFGVVNGIRAFVPRFVEQNEGHVVNTSSAAGLVTGPLIGPYYATKHAVVALSESLQLDLGMAGADVGVSVLCPEWVRTTLTSSERNRPGDVSPSPVASGGEASLVQPLIDAGIEPDEVAGAALEAVRSGRFWVFTHPSTLPAAQKRWQAIESDGQPVPWSF